MSVCIYIYFSFCCFVCVLFCVFCPIVCAYMPTPIFAAVHRKMHMYIYIKNFFVHVRMCERDEGDHDCAKLTYSMGKHGALICICVQ